MKRSGIRKTSAKQKEWTEEWVEARRKALEAAEYVCEGKVGLMCSGPLVVHHRRSRGVKDERTNAPANLMVLCSSCHDHIHAFPQWSRKCGYIVSKHADPAAVVVHRAR